MKKKILFLVGLLCIAGWGPLDPQLQDWLHKETKILSRQARNLDPEVLRLSLIAYQKIRQAGYDHKQLITIIDYDKFSSMRRFFVIDMKHEKVLFNTWVSHGKNSGDVLATSFSNQPGSLKSVVGVLLTDTEPYFGNNGYSLRLYGLEQGINDNAYQRDIVVHGAWYVGWNALKRYGQIGRSWGCPAVSENLVHPIIDTIKGNTLVFVYSSDRHWLSRSNFLG